MLLFNKMKEMKESSSVIARPSHFQDQCHLLLCSWDRIIDGKRSCQQDINSVMFRRSWPQNISLHLLIHLPGSWLVLHSSTAKMTSSWPLESELLSTLRDRREGLTPTSWDRALGSGPPLFAMQLRTWQKHSFHREHLLIWFPTGFHHSITHHSLFLCKSVKFSLNGSFFAILITNNHQGFDKSSNQSLLWPYFSFLFILLNLNWKRTGRVLVDRQPSFKSKVP